MHSSLAHTVYKYTHVLKHERQAPEIESYYLLVFLGTDLHCMCAVYLGTCVFVCGVGHSSSSVRFPLGSVASRVQRVWIAK